MKKAAPTVLVLLCLFFVLAGAAFIPRLGIQNDEVFFTAGLYEPFTYRYGIRLFHTRVPLMLLSYLGATKTWFYAAWFQLWPPSPSSLRVPMLLGGALTVWLFYLLVRRLAGIRAALLGAGLLATDAVYLLVTLWGPVIGHHVLLLSAMLAFLAYHRTRSARWLAAGCFCVGLALWDKALFLWLLSGLVVAALAVFPRAVLRALTWRNLGIAGVCLAIGALPLALFNYKYRGETIRSNTSLTLADVPAKAQVLRLSLDGWLLFGWIVAEDPPPHPGEPGNALERGSLWLSELTGRRDQSLMLWACGFAVLLLPWLWRTPARAPMLFTLICFGVGWVQMAITRGAGLAAHHTLLLWPFPHLLVAVALAEASRRLRRTGAVTLVIVGVLLVGSNALVVNQYLADAVRKGPGLDFTDAVYRLAGYLRQTPAKQVLAADWGMVDSLRFLEQGRLRLRLVADLAAKPSLTIEEARRLREWIAEPGHIFVAHIEGREFFRGASARLRQIALEQGYAPDTLAVLSDNYSRPTYEVFRFQPVRTE